MKHKLEAGDGVTNNGEEGLPMEQVRLKWVPVYVGLVQIRVSCSIEMIKNKRC
jgi:hypothetical protein